MYGVIAEGNGRKAPPKIQAPFTSVARLREIEEGIVTLLEKMGRVRGGERSIDTFFKRVYKYDANAKAVAQTDKGATIALRRVRAARGGGASMADQAHAALARRRVARSVRASQQQRVGHLDGQVT